MRRFTRAVLISPLLGSLAFGPLFIVAFVYLLIFTVFAGIPFFLLASKLKILYWWVATLVGALGAFAFVSLSSYNFDGSFDTYEIMGILAGTITGFAFWWIEIYKNPKYSFVKSTFPISSLLLVPFLIGLIYLIVVDYRGRALGKVVALLDDRTVSATIQTDGCSARVLLANGRTADARYYSCDQSRIKRELNSCVELTGKWSIPQLGRAYTIRAISDSAC